MPRNKSKSFIEKVDKFSKLKIDPYVRKFQRYFIILITVIINFIKEKLRKYTSSKENNSLKKLEELNKTPKENIKSFEKFGLKSNESMEEPKFKGNELLLYNSPRLVNAYLKKNDPAVVDITERERLQINTGKLESNILKDSDKISINFIEHEPNFSTTISNFDKMKSFKFYFVENNIEEVLKRAKKRFSPINFKRKNNSKSRSPKKQSISNKK